jgi:hypothetical protein
VGAGLTDIAARRTAHRSSARPSRACCRRTSCATGGSSASRSFPTRRIRMRPSESLLACACVPVSTRSGLSLAPRPQHREALRPRRRLCGVKSALAATIDWDRAAEPPSWAADVLVLQLTTRMSAWTRLAPWLCCHRCMRCGWQAKAGCCAGARPSSCAAPPRARGQPCERCLPLHSWPCPLRCISHWAVLQVTDEVSTRAHLVQQQRAGER